MLLRRRKTPTAEQRNAVEGLIALTKTQYDPNNKEHVAALERVREKFQVEDWTSVGFQRKESPVTDFRGFGMLTVECMLRTHAHERMQKFRTGDSNELQLGLTIINIGNAFLQRLRHDDAFLVKYTFSRDLYVDDFVAYVDRLLVDFEKFWFSTHPQNIMSFNQVWEQYAKKHLK